MPDRKVPKSEKQSASRALRPIKGEKPVPSAPADESAAKPAESLTPFLDHFSFERPHNALLPSYKKEKAFWWTGRWRDRVKAWNPFEWNFQWPANNKDPYRFMVLCAFDLRMPLKDLIKRISIIYGDLRKEVFIPSHKGRYLEEEKELILKYLDQGIPVIEIFRKLHPRYKNFKYTRDVTIGGQKKAAKVYQRFNRMVKRVKEEIKYG